MPRTSLQVSALILSLVASGVAFQAPSAEGPVALVPRLPPRLPSEAQPVLRVDASLVMIPAHVTNALGAPATGLEKRNFRIFEDGVEQAIVHFSSDDAPVSIGVLLDTSGSMQNKMQKSSEAAAAFFRTANAEDEFFLVKFSGRARLAVPFTPDSDQLYKEIARTKPFGQTSLLDAVHVALGQMKKAQNPRKAIVILSDGGDNWSRHSVRQITNDLIESDVLVYAMGIFDPDYSIRHPSEERRGPQLLEALAEQTGGRHLPVDDLDELPAISARIGRALRNQYLLGYYSTNSMRDGKYRHVKLELAIPGPAPSLRTYYRRGYYGPVE